MRVYYTGEKNMLRRKSRYNNKTPYVAMQDACLSYHGHQCHYYLYSKHLYFFRLNL